jgi:hypothetical protein
MSYLPQFKNDLFISYRRVDDESYRELNWIKKFRDDLGIRLRSLVSNDVEIWRDEDKIKVGEDFRNAIATALDATAVFLAVMSRTYLDSKECVDELDQFLGKLKEATDERPIRVVPIFKHPPKPDQTIPPELGGLDHYEFFERDKNAPDRFTEFYPEEGNPTAKFWSSLERLAADLSNYLETTKGRARKRTIATLYLAQVGPELYTHREVLRTELQQRNYLVLPEHPLLWNASDVDERIVSYLDSAELSVHLISGNSSFDRNGAARARRQLDRALSTMSKKPSFFPLIWIQPGVEPIDEASQALIKYVRDEASNQGAEYLDGSLEEFKTHIYDKLKPKNPTTKPSAVASTSRGIALFVENRDKVAANEIRRFLNEIPDVEPLRIIFADDSPENPSFFDEVLKRYRQFIVFWGSVDESWVERLLIRLHDAGHSGTSAVCVYVLEPQSDDKSMFVTKKAITVNGTNGVNSEELKKFLDQGL